MARGQHIYLVAFLRASLSLSDLSFAVETRSLKWSISILFWALSLSIVYNKKRKPNKKQEKI